jgi:hypothetical protein
MIGNNIFVIRLSIIYQVLMVETAKHDKYYLDNLINLILGRDDEY